MEEEEQQFCLRWNNFQSNITSQFEVLRDEEDFVDVTLACDGQHVKAHKVVLSACSPYFKELFRSNPCKHPILFMRDVEFQHLQSLVEFMYTGEVNVAQAHLTAFLHTAESLQIRGLTEGPQQHKQQQLPPDSSLPSAAKVQRQLQGLSTSVTQKQLTPHHHTNNNKAPSVTSRHNSLSSPEGTGNDGNEDEVFSLSPPSSPLPPKRQCRGELLESNNLQSSSVSHLLNNQDLIVNKPDLESYKDDSLEILEPKLEVPDYNSDSESKTDSAAMASNFLGLDTNSVDINATMASLHSGMEMPGTSAQNFLGETSQDSAQVDLRKLHSLDPRPCPICNRMYSNLSNLRQHVRLIHNPQTVECPLCSKPFKTKLYLKRHLMSFHELLCTSPGAPQPARGPIAQGGEFFPPPQAFLGQQCEEKGAYQGSPAKRSMPGQVSEFYQNLRLFGNANSEERGTFHNNQSVSGSPEVVPFSSSPLPQGCKEERGGYQARGPDKLTYRPHQPLENKPPEIPVPASFLNTLSHSNNNVRSSLLPLHANDEEMPTFLSQQMNTNTQESTAFLSSLSHEKTDKGSSYLDSVLHSGGREECTHKQAEGK